MSSKAMRFSVIRDGGESGLFGSSDGRWVQAAEVGGGHAGPTRAFWGGGER